MRLKASYTNVYVQKKNNINIDCDEGNVLYTIFEFGLKIMSFWVLGNKFLRNTFL